MGRLDMDPTTELSDSVPVWSVRPAEPGDAAAVQSLCGHPALPAVHALLRESQQAFAGDAARTARHVFVVCEDNRVRGVAAVVDQLGMSQPRYSFRAGVVVHASTEMAMFNTLQTLTLGNDTTGATELVLPVQLAGLPMHALAALIQAMLWYVADVPKRFAPHVVCELPGIGERRVDAPFWHALGRHFHAGVLPVDHDLFAGDERGAIGRLMPKHTVYSALLSDLAQSCVGQPSSLAAQLQEALLVHGFRFWQHLNMFDAGPILEGQISDLRGLALQPMRSVRVLALLDHRSVQRCCLRRSDRALAPLWVASAQIEGGAVAVSAVTARTLAVESGQHLHVVACL